MRRDVRRHPDRDPRPAVDQQVRDPGRQYGRLLGTAVVVRPEIDGVLVDVRQHLHRQRREPAFGVMADETVGDESVVLSVDAQAVDGLHAGVDDGPDLGVVEPPVDERFDDVEYLTVRDPFDDLVAALLPPLDAVDIVSAQPVPLGPPDGTVGPDVLGDEGHVVGAHRARGVR